MAQSRSEDPRMRTIRALAGWCIPQRGGAALPRPLRQRCAADGRVPAHRGHGTSANRRRPALGSDRGAARFPDGGRRNNAGHHPWRASNPPDPRAPSNPRDFDDPRRLPPSRHQGRSSTAHAPEQTGPDVKARRQARFELQPDRDPAKLVFLVKPAPRPGWPAGTDAAPKVNAAGEPSRTGHRKTTTLVAELRRGASPHRGERWPYGRRDVRPLCRARSGAEAQRRRHRHSRQSVRPQSHPPPGRSQTSRQCPRTWCRNTPIPRERRQG
jgi:hypothetical protein